MYLRTLGDAEVYSPGVVELEPRHHLEPDLLVVPTTALPQAGRTHTRWANIREWWLAVEVSGKDSELYDRDHKGPAYLALGVREFWRVDLQDQCLYTLRIAKAPRSGTGTGWNGFRPVGPSRW